MNKIIMPYPISINKYYNTVGKIRKLAKEGREYKKFVKLSNLKIKPTHDYYTIHIIIYPKLNLDNTISKKTIDIDNGLKCILDSLENIIYYNDNQIKKLIIEYADYDLINNHKYNVKRGEVIVFYETMQYSII